METLEQSGDEVELSESIYQNNYNLSGRLSENEDEGEGMDGEPMREQDRFLPTANVARIMKRTIPKFGKIAKEAKDCVQECVSEFVSFITSEASERCHQEKRKTINGEDILFAMATLGFDNYIDPLKTYLNKYRESTKSEKFYAEDKVLEINSEQPTFVVQPENQVIYTSFSKQ